MFAVIGNNNHRYYTLLYFVRSGYIELPFTVGRLRAAGIVGFGWSSMGSSRHYTGSTTPSAYYLKFDAAIVGPSNGPHYRWYGFPFRSPILIQN